MGECTLGREFPGCVCLLVCFMSFSSMPDHHYLWIVESKDQGIFFQLSLCRPRWLPFQKTEAVFHCFVLSFLGSFHGFGEFAYTHYPWRNPIKSWFLLILFYFRKKFPPIFQQESEYVIYPSLVQISRYFTGKCADLIWHSLFKERCYNFIDILHLWKKEDHYMTGTGWSNTRWRYFKESPIGAGFSQTSVQCTWASKGCKQMGKVLRIFLIGSHGKIRPKVRFHLERNFLELTPACEGTLM